ncbi:ester cyclase [Microbispora sp. H11081]|uniref:ester cyclase n=1 Tax=Microbispora sp. H11081 TaxID=2729107 RepID=UPI001475AC6F|nr:nuclear transport factor 2 family protein [Microbispora sp. H11081]
MAEIAVLIETLADAINHHDEERLVRCFTPRAVFVTPAGVTEGHEQIGWYFRQLFIAFPDLRNESTAQAVLDDTVVVEWTFNGTHTGPLLLPGGTEVMGTGRRVVVPAASAYTMGDDGVFASGRVYYDQLTFYRQTGYDLRLRRPG